MGSSTYPVLRKDEILHLQHWRTLGKTRLNDLHDVVDQISHSSIILATSAENPVMQQNMGGADIWEESRQPERAGASSVSCSSCVRIRYSELVSSNGTRVTCQKIAGAMAHAMEVLLEPNGREGGQPFCHQRLILLPFLVQM